MTCTGTVKGGVIVLEPGSAIPDGTVVRIETVGSEEDLKRLRDGLLELAGTLHGPSDLARNHDHYIHGTPKK